MYEYEYEIINKKVLTENKRARLINLLNLYLKHCRNIDTVTGPNYGMKLSKFLKQSGFTALKFKPCCSGWVIVSELK